VSKASKRERQRENRERRREIELSMQKRSQRLRALRNALIVAVPIIVIIVFFQLNSGGGSSNKKAASPTCSNVTPPAVTQQSFPQAPALTIDPAKTYTALMKTSCGNITIALDAKQAPKTVNSFVFLAQKNFFDGTLFHRIVTDFVDQGGDPKGDGTGGPGYTLPDEPPATAYTAGSVAMAENVPNTGGSQFFLTVSENGAKRLGTTAPFKYSDLGQITKGLDVAQKINTYGSTDLAGTPTKKIYVLGVTISVNGTPLTTPTTAPAPVTPAPATPATAKP
jgi:cyclophilin family peptidyl-prolyl cis-trans isomerase